MSELNKEKYRDCYYSRSESRSVCMYFRDDHYPFRYRATASASNVGEYWWVDRVFVTPELRGCGFGKGLLTEVLDMIRERGGGLVRVCPGGYNMKYSDQFKFYEACGFKEARPGEMVITV